MLKSPPEAQDQLSLLEKKFDSIVSKLSTGVGRTSLFAMDIPITGLPITCKPYPIPLKDQSFINEEIQLLESAGCISKSLSPLAAPVIAVPKKLYSLFPDKQ